MVYLIDPNPMIDNRCPGKCKTLCSLCTLLCGIKPMYGIDPTPI